MATGDKKPIVMGEPIGVEGGPAPNTHAARHAADGADPITPDMIGAASNPNLLDNWYFADPIDQRGGLITTANTLYYSDPDLGNQVGLLSEPVTARHYNEYVASIVIDNVTYYVHELDVERGYIGTGYGIDRWRTNYSGDTVVLNTNGVKNTNASTVSGWHFHQIIEDDVRALVGKTITVSFLINEIKNAQLRPIVSFRNSSDSEISNFKVYGKAGLATVSGVVPDGTVKMRIGFYGYAGVVAGDYVEVKAAKLELGSVQTLAHQDENGNWVLNDPPPNKQQELAKCQRYQLGLQSAGYMQVRATSVGVNNAFFYIPVPTTLRTTPTLTGTVHIRAYGSTDNEDGFNYEVSALGGSGYVRVIAIKSEHGLTDATLLLYKDVFLDANL